MKYNQLYKAALWSSICGILIFIIDFGFTQSSLSQNILNGLYLFILILGIVSTIARYFEKDVQIKRQVVIFDILSISIVLVIIVIHFSKVISMENIPIFYNDIWLKFAIILTLIRELSEQNFNFQKAIFNPAQLFIISFLGVILIGSLLLMLPNATVGDFSYIDALFTSTSAVCVTGLIVVDTGSYFTLFGQALIVILIQIGGLGILTFASYFSYFFKGGSSYENQLTLGELTSSRKIGEVFSTLKNIIIITLTVESVAAILIFLSISGKTDHSFGEDLFFSVFHAISAFCNAGFSTLTDSLYDTNFKFNYSLQMVVIITFIFGGLGFPIVVNIINFLKYKALNLFTFNGKSRTHKPWILNINSRITLVTTFSLTTIAFFLFYILEFNNVLTEHRGIGKFVVALFGAATPRTAGFNNVDMTALTFPTIMITLLLMWIGASPSSTGGGIKTSTFAIAILNILSLAKGKLRVEIYRRQIADISIRRAFAIISLSLIIIGMGILFITVFDPEKGLMNIAFECFSAYSTVGLSLGITADLSFPSKIVIIIIMFVGRVSMLSIIIAIFIKVKHKNYRYPTEEITMN